MRPTRPPLSGSPSQTQGGRVETIACDYLRQHRHRILQRNFRCQAGELDIISQDAAHLVITEVRYRKSRLFGDAAATVNRAKQQKIIRTTYYFLQTRPELRHASVRFDVIAVGKQHGRYTINWIRNAFEET